MQAIWDENVDGWQNALENGWASAIENSLKAERDQRMKVRNRPPHNEKLEQFKAADVTKFVKDKLEEFQK